MRWGAEIWECCLCISITMADALTDGIRQKERAKGERDQTQRMLLLQTPMHLFDFNSKVSTEIRVNSKHFNM